MSFAFRRTAIILALAASTASAFAQTYAPPQAAPNDPCRSSGKDRWVRLGAARRFARTLRWL